MFDLKVVMSVLKVEVLGVKLFQPPAPPYGLASSWNDKLITLVIDDVVPVVAKHAYPLSNNPTSAAISKTLTLLSYSAESLL